jgi:ATP-dependent Lon protease|tara:strand:+ start:449 stop:568 length:120 start_codon:yes stop_codon:yes gene_type:complete
LENIYLFELSKYPPKDEPSAGATITTSIVKCIYIDYLQE